MTPCVLWTGAVNASGYGRLGNQLAHRMVWEMANGPIPEGHQIHHTCFVRLCINLDHLECVTAAENNSQKKATTRVECSNGHPFTPENTYRPPGSIRRRLCRRCNADAATRKRNRKKVNA